MSVLSLGADPIVKKAHFLHMGADLIVKNVHFMHTGADPIVKNARMFWRTPTDHNVFCAIEPKRLHSTNLFEADTRKRKKKLRSRA